MPNETQDFAVTAVPAALEDLITFTDGTSYEIANDSPSIVVYRVAASQPDADSAGHPIPPYRSAEFTFGTGTEKTWMWTRDPPATLVITEIA